MLLEARGIRFRYNQRSSDILKNLTFSVEEGERVGIVAPSGYGKTTFLKILAGYVKPNEGQILLDGKPLPVKGVSPVQMINQHPEYAVNPRWRMEQVLKESGQLKEDMIRAMGIEQEWLKRFPNELSGGELQRFCVARALCENTRFLIADEISTMLDVITQAQIWNFLLVEVEKRNIGMVVVSHNLDLIDRVCSRVLDLTEINCLK